MPVEFKIKLKPNVDDPNRIKEFGLKGGAKSWMTTMRMYPPQAPGVEYHRTRVMAKFARATFKDSQYMHQDSVDLTSTDYAKSVLLRKVFNGGFIVWAEKADALIDNVKAGFRKGIREATTIKKEGGSPDASE